MDAFTRLDQQQYEAMKRRVRELQASLPVAVSACFDIESQQIVVQLSSRVEIRFSPEDAEGLEQAPSVALDRIEITASGFGIRFPDLNVDLSVPAVLLGRFGTQAGVTSRRKDSLKRNGFGSPLPKTDRPSDKSKLNRPKLVEVSTGKQSAWHGLRPIAGGLATTRAPEGTYAKVEEHEDYDGGDQKHSVIRAMGPARPHAPEIWSERDDWQEKESARNLKPQDASDTSKRPQKPADAPSHIRAGLSACTDGLPRVVRMNSNVPNRLRASRWSSVRASRKPFAHHAAGDAYADSQDASDRLWSHPIYDGSSDSA